MGSAATPSMVDLAGRVLLVIGVFTLVLCAIAALPGIVDWVRREVGWRRFERRRRAHVDGIIRSEFAAFRERWRGGDES